MITVRLSTRVRIGGLGSGAGSGVGLGYVRLTSVPLEAIRHRALQPRDRAALLLGHELAVSG